MTGSFVLTFTPRVLSRVNIKTKSTMPDFASGTLFLTKKREKKKKFPCSSTLTVQNRNRQLKTMMVTNTELEHINVPCHNDEPSTLHIQLSQTPIVQNHGGSFNSSGFTKKLTASKASLSSASTSFKKPQLSSKMKKYLEIDVVGTKCKPTSLQQQSMQPATMKRRYMRRGSSTPSMIAAAAAASASFAKKTNSQPFF